MAMNIPAYTVPALSRLGCTFDCHTARPCIEIFPADIPTKTEYVNKLAFKFKAVSSNADVKELMHLPSDFPLRIKANMLSVEGPGKYLNDNLKIEGEKTEILAVMTCVTVSKKAEYSVKPNDISKRKQLVDGLGTHYVRKISYGGQMVASVKLNFPPNSSGPRLRGIVEGDLTSEATAVDLSNRLNSILTDCRDASNISVTYYTTELPYQTGTAHNLDELMRLFRDFRSKTIANGKEIPVEVELQQTGTLIPSARAYLPNMALTNTVEEIESRFDDIRTSQYLVKTYVQDPEDEDMKRFSQDVEKVCQTFTAAITTLNTSADDTQFNECFMAYENALDGIDEEGKFTSYWRNLLTKEEAITSTIQLPTGKKLTIVVIGKAGSGKSATANSIVGRRIFTTSSSATSTVSSKFQFGCRIDERQIDVLDTPGSLSPGDLQDEASRILELAPKGFDAIVLVAKYGCRLTGEDAQALQLLQGVLGDNVRKYIILVLSFGDQAEHEATEDRTPLSSDELVDTWLQTSPDWVQTFIDQIGEDRVVSFNNRLKPHSQPEAYKRQLSKLIKAIDDVSSKTPPYLESEPARNDFKRKIKEASMKPNRAGREGDSFEGWCLPDLEANMSEEGGTENEGRPLHERVWSFMNTYCNIL
ncbi:uncharacterized protein [Porites lutea]|uniref:uncharacterized protein n=1 Tax=Porites lutea TaxID=51062 RepID=UPI003CC6291E